MGQAVKQAFAVFHLFIFPSPEIKSIPLEYTGEKWSAKDCGKVMEMASKLHFTFPRAGVVKI